MFSCLWSCVCLENVKIVNLQGKLKSNKKLASELSFDFCVDSVGERFTSALIQLWYAYNLLFSMCLMGVCNLIYVCVCLCQCVSRTVFWPSGNMGCRGRTSNQMRWTHTHNSTLSRLHTLTQDWWVSASCSELSNQMKEITQMFTNLRVGDFS